MKSFRIVLFAAFFTVTTLHVQGQIELGLHASGAQIGTTNGNLATRNGLGGGFAFHFQFLDHYRLGLTASFLAFEPTADEPDGAPSYRLYPMEASLEYTPFTTLPVRPYLSGTLGFYHLRQETTTAEAGSGTTEQSDLGFGGGLGLRVPLKGTLELDASLRYLYLPAEEGPRTVLPLQVGLVYRFED